MKSVAILSCALLGAVYAQDINSVPECGRTCIQNMLGQQENLGCPPANGQPDPSCLCNNADFSFGLRDCAQQACGTEVEDAVVTYGVAYCQSAGVAIPTTVISGTPTATGSASGSESGSATAESSAITTSSFATTITSGDSTITTSAATTIFGVGGGAASSASSAASEASESASSVGESASSAASSVASSASDAAGSATSAAGSATSAAGSAASSATAEGFAPQMTAAPAAGFLAAAGIAAMLL